jgi:hypothetical protein
MKLGVLLWAAGMAGVVALSVTVIPQLLSKAPQQVPVNVALAASLLQSGVLLALAVWAGVALSKPVGLCAPVIEAMLSGSGLSAALKRQILPAALGGLLVARLLVYLNSAAPSELQALGTEFQIPLAAKLLYGGVTEEILMRWGLMTVLIWLPWRFLQGRNGTPRNAYVVVGIVLAALLFGLGHLPAVVAMGAELNPPVVTYIVVGNTLPGILFGVLYWRRGLEAAILAHALAHAVSTLALQPGVAA